MNDPLAIRFINEYQRTTSETVDDLRSRLHVLKTVWQDEVQSKVLNNESDLIEDGREAEGVTRLTGSDVYANVAALNSVLAILEDNESVIRKLCVRVPKVY
jgi:hypothetical protein